MKTSFERTMGKSYLYVEAETDTPSFEEEMLKNEIPGLLSVQKGFRNNAVMYVYDITQKISLREYFKEHKLNEDLICTIVDEIIRIMKEARNYLLESGNFIISTDYIYVGNHGTEFRLCYYIGYGVSLQEQLASLFEEWMRIVDYQDQKAVKLVYELFHQVREAACTYEQILEIIERTMQSSGMVKETQGVENCFEMRQPVSDRVLAAKEELAGEREVLYYPLKSYLILGGTIIAVAAGFIVCWCLNGFRTPFGQPDIMKILCFFVIGGAVAGYAGFRAFAKDRRYSKMIPVSEEISIHDAPVPEEMPIAINLDKTEGIEEKVSIGPAQAMQQFEKESYDRYRSLQSGQSLQANADQMGKEEALEEEKTQVLYEEKTEVLALRSVLRLVPEIDSAGTIEICLPEALLGSSAIQADYCLPYKTVSRCHARVCCRSDTFYVEDLNSTNGTFVNHKRCSPGDEYVLKQGDCVQIAEYTYYVELIG